jgi:hypothetical protein
MLTEQERKERAVISKRKYYLKNLEACRARSKRQREENHEAYLAYLREYRKRPEAIEADKAAARAYRIRRAKMFPDLVMKKQRASVKAWRKRHPEAYKAMKQRSYIRRRDWLGGSYVRQMVVQNTPLSRRDCPAPLVEMKREQLKAWRVQHEIRCAMVEN